MLEELAEPREVALRRGDVAVRLDRVEPGHLAVDVTRDPPVRGRPRDHDVVPRAVGQHAEGGLHGAGAVLDIHALVAHRIAVVGARTVGDRVADPDVAVAQHQPPTGDRVATDGHVVELQVPRLQGVVRRGAEVGQLPHLAVDDRRRHTLVVEQRRVGGEPLLPHQLLVPEPALIVAESRVSGTWDRAHRSVVSHPVSLPRGDLAWQPWTHRSGCRHSSTTPRSSRRRALPSTRQ